MNFLASFSFNFLTNSKRYSNFSPSKTNFHFLNFGLLHEDSKRKKKSLKRYSIIKMGGNFCSPLILNH